MAETQVPEQETAKQVVPPKQQQGCGCGNAQVAAAVAERIKVRMNKVYRTKFKVF